MADNIGSRESKVMDFINAKNAEKAKTMQIDKINDSPEIKLRKLDKECKNGVSVCLDTILGRIYKDTLPFDDPKKNCSDDEARGIVNDYISRRTNGQNSEYYIREAIKRNKSTILQNILEDAQNIVNKFYHEKAKDIANINIRDLNFNPNLHKDKFDNISKKNSFDEISEIIINNVKSSIQAEKDKANKEEEYNKNLQSMLEDDPTVVDDTSMESAIERFQFGSMPNVYKPSLLESIMLGKSKHLQESTCDDILLESVREYTLLNISKALKLETFNLRMINEMVESYLV